MKYLNLVVLSALVLGCVSGPGPQIHPAPVSNVSVVVNDQETLKKAIIAAATRRRWVPTEADAKTIRCTLIQRLNKVEIDVVLNGGKSYSISCVSCNIPEAKYQQWLGNLQREIALQATLVK